MKKTRQSAVHEYLDSYLELDMKWKKRAQSAELMWFSYDSTASGCSVFKWDRKAELYIRALEERCTVIQNNNKQRQTHTHTHSEQDSCKGDNRGGGGSERGRRGRTGNVIMAKTTVCFRAPSRKQMDLPSLHGWGDCLHSLLMRG